MNHYENLTTIPGISGHEHFVRSYMESVIKKYPQYQIVKDKLGSVFAYKKSSNPNALTVLIAGHMDEVGLMVRGIKDNGAIELLPIGGLSADVFISQILYVYTEEGKKIPGIIGSVPPHLKQKNVLEIKNLLLDIGTESKEETLSYGIKLGDMVLFDTPYIETVNQKRFMAKSIDNRFGCGLALEAIEKFKDETFDFNLAIGATVQEEVGLRGAETSTNLFKPDLFIALDSSPLNDLYQASASGKLGDGFLLRIFDPKNIMLFSLKDYFKELALKHKIKYQPYISMGGTDAAKAIDMHEGILSTTIGLPARYIHSSVAMADYFDLEQARKMLFVLISDLTSDKIQQLKEEN
ncbi:Glutamyl aminopeptidase [Acholeplasma oculi]|uniref:Glutamyl aminopeptidase, M42 family n=1 Tax=Acholeplasma oculi TaxID=35623 RepID=A0A061ABA7_9MOLU|nr:M42 family metallopeptidase [Acholeplasma oculi]CDR31133.1 Glutamyl aminopeptidase, M42 family [Acholeplasma oculi]SKC37320.1 glutamyl aminopeptidase [Acholeplasma oculi]SUT90901.1 Glutamyl aminopeptidase [Acholeplasma oculi]